MRDQRYDTVKGLLKENKIEKFTDIFKWIPKTIVAEDLHTNNGRMKRMVENPEDFSMKDIYTIASLIGCDAKKLLMMAAKEGSQKRKKS